MLRINAKGLCPLEMPSLTPAHSTKSSWSLSLYKMPTMQGISFGMDTKEKQHRAVVGGLFSFPPDGHAEENHQTDHEKVYQHPKSLAPMSARRQAGGRCRKLKRAAGWTDLMSQCLFLPQALHDLVLRTHEHHLIVDPEQKSYY